MAHSDTSFILSDLNLYTGTPQNNWHMACLIYQKIIVIFEELLDGLMFIVVHCYVRNFTNSTIS